MSISGNSSIGSNIPKLMPQTSGTAPTGGDVIDCIASRQSNLSTKRAEAEAAAEKADTFLNRTFRKGKIKDLESQAQSLKQAEEQMKQAMEMIQETLEKLYETMYS